MLFLFILFLSLQPFSKSSTTPTGQPTKQPIGHPSSRPTIIPSGQPTRQPIGHPSSRPTIIPSGQPTRQPFSHPSTKPTGAPVLKNTMTIQSLTGFVTNTEIISFKHYVNTVSKIDINNIGNAYVYGISGSAIEALGLMYEVTGDIDILDRMMEFTEGALLCRIYNLTWTGKYEYIWPNPVVTTEQGDIVGHIAYNVKMILQTPSIWNNTVLIGNNTFGITYYDRAITYLYQANQTVDYLVNFIPFGSGGNNGAPIGSGGTSYTGNTSFLSGVSPGYTFPNVTYFRNPSSFQALRPVPWNQQMMINNAFQRLAECYEILGDHDDLVIQFDTYVNNSFNYFFDNVIPYTSHNKQVYLWPYSKDNNPFQNPEDTAHGSYDTWGLFRGYHSGRYNISLNEMTIVANTIQYVVTNGTNKYLNFVYPIKNVGTTNYLLQGYIFMGIITPTLYFNISHSDIIAGGRQNQNPLITAAILWVKNYYYTPEQLVVTHSQKVDSNTMIILITVIPGVFAIGSIYMAYRYWKHITNQELSPDHVEKIVRFQELPSYV